MVEENFGICHPKMALNNESFLLFLYLTVHHGWRKFGICHPKIALNNEICWIFQCFTLRYVLQYQYFRNLTSGVPEERNWRG